MLETIMELQTKTSKPLGEDAEKMNNLILIGSIGDYIAYLNTGKKEAINDYKENYGEIDDTMEIKEIVFKTKFRTYEIWAGI